MIQYRKPGTSSWDLQSNKVYSSETSTLRAAYCIRTVCASVTAAISSHKTTSNCTLTVSTNHLFLTSVISSRQTSASCLHSNIINSDVSCESTPTNSLKYQLERTGSHCKTYFNLCAQPAVSLVTRCCPDSGAKRLAHLKDMNSMCRSRWWFKWDSFRYYDLH